MRRVLLAAVLLLSFIVCAVFMRPSLTHRTFPKSLILIAQIDKTAVLRYAPLTIHLRIFNNSNQQITIVQPELTDDLFFCMVARKGEKRFVAPRRENVDG